MTEESWSAIEQHIRDYVDCEVVVFPSSGGHMIVVLKGYKPGIIAEAKHDSIDDVARVDQYMIDTGFTDGISGLWRKFGKDFPMVILEGTSATIHFKSWFTIDFTEPNFFDQLNLALDYALIHDSFSGFSLSP